jgi:heme-degrading monooxygenase HmoA
MSSVTTDAISVANCISGPRDLAGWISEAFRPFLPGLKGLDGFREFQLLEVIHEGPDCMFVSISTWDSLAAFENWREGGSFITAHDAARADTARFGKLRHARRYDFHAAPVSDLTATLLEQIGNDYDGVWINGARLAPRANVQV